MDPNLMIVCGIAFLAVMLLLGFMAAAISFMTWLFPAPAPPRTADAPVIAAIQSVVAARLGGARVTKIEENP